MKTVETYCIENGIKFDVDFICEVNDKLMDYCNDNDIDYLGDVLNDHWEFEESLLNKFFALGNLINL